MIKFIEYLVATILLACLSDSAFGQDTTIFKVGPCPASITTTYSSLIIIDGFPGDLSKIQPETIDSMNYISRDTVFDCKGRIKYSGIIEILTNDTLHTGLRYVYLKTKKWILHHPFTEFELNGKFVTEYDNELISLIYFFKPDQIKKVELVKNNRRVGECYYDLIKIKIKQQSR